MRIDRNKVVDWVDIGVVVILGLALLSILALLLALMFGFVSGPNVCQ